MHRIFILVAIESRSNRYPRRQKLDWTIGYFSSRSRAEKELARVVEATNAAGQDAYSDRIGYMLFEKTADCAANGAYSSPCCLSVRSYTKEGSLWDECLIPDDCETPFEGRRAEDIRFHHRDIVEVVQYGGAAELSIVSRTPFTPEEYAVLKTRFEDDRHHPILDYSDDCYLVYSLGEGDTHEHVMCCYAFPPSKPVSSTLQEKLKAKLKEMEDAIKNYKP